MLKKGIIKSFNIAFVTLLVAYISMLVSIPESITLYEGENADRVFDGPPGIIAEKSDNGLILKALGLFPLKTVKVDVLPDEYIMASGSIIGVRMSIKGLLTVSLSAIETAEGMNVYPARDGGLKPGDLIMKANGIELSGSYDLVGIVENSNGNPLELDIVRNSDNLKLSINPVKAAADGKYHVGIWIRDTAAGIGTLTYLEPETHKFGALGHGISDADTGILVPLKSGFMYQAAILSIKKGESGTPGELSGMFIEEWGELGYVEQNSDSGIYGRLRPEQQGMMEFRSCARGSPNSAREGSAVILSDISGKGVKSYNIEIQKIARSPVSGKKSIILKVTDESLLNLTGGIVQGMSGSPIIQEGRLIGAITHVFVNDPQRGYGILFEQMYKK